MIHKLTIDTDKFCRECGAEGATDNNLCLRCSADKALANINKSGYTQQDSRHLPVVLTPHEVEEYGKELATVIISKGKLEAERSVLNRKIKPLVERLEDLAPIVDSGIEGRDVECRWYYDWASGERFLIRLDTRELVETDTIPEWERQNRLDFEGGTAGEPEQPEEEENQEEEAPAVCQNAECDQFSDEEANHCLALEHAHECGDSSNLALGEHLAQARQARKGA
jgi:hypothetical protein